MNGFAYLDFSYRAVWGIVKLRVPCPTFAVRLVNGLPPFLFVIPISIGNFVGRAATTTRHLAQCAQHNQFIDVAQGGIG